MSVLYLGGCESGEIAGSFLKKCSESEGKKNSRLECFGTQAFADVFWVLETEWSFSVTDVTSSEKLVTTVLTSDKGPFK